MFSHPDGIVQSIEEASVRKHQGPIDYGVSHEISDEEYSSDEQDIIPEEAFYRKCGYLPPLDDEATAIIDALMEDPAKAKGLARINPSSDAFFQGLRRRNIVIEETTTLDPYADINHLAENTAEETNAERESYGRLWALDRANCVNGSSEALFQRTIMMGLIARHCLIYRQGATKPSCLDFSVEEPWTCPPMPTAGYSVFKGLTQPKPPLAVCFKRNKVIPESLWIRMPYATQRLACYEKPGISKAFHFFTLEAKRSQTIITNLTTLYQNLNNASQALHNMFEFCQDAGPRYRERFFSQVRFFSAVSSTEGLIVRIHRAVQVAENGSEEDIHIPDYPLRFEFREFVKVSRENFDRETVLKILGKIFFSYAAGELLGLLQDAAKALAEKLGKGPAGEVILRTDAGFYRHGQFGNTPASSRTQTVDTSRGPSTYSQMSVDTERSAMLPGPANMAAARPNPSIDMAQSRTATPTQSHPSPSTQIPSNRGKRVRSQHEDGNAPRRGKRLRH